MPESLEAKEKRKIRQHKQYLKNREKYLEKSKQYRKDHLEQFRAYRKKWYQEHPEQILELRAKYNNVSDHKEKTLRHRKKYVALWEQIIKELGYNKCIICGYDKCFNAIDFHHLDPKEKKYNLATKMRGLPKEEYIQEIKKCIPVCSNCHREIHSGVTTYVQTACTPPQEV